MKKWLFYPVLCLFGLFLAACGTTPPTATPAPTLTIGEGQPTAVGDINPTATATLIAVSASPTSEAPPPAEPTATTPPTATSTAEPTATSQPSAAACLIGRWRISNFETYLQQTLTANAPGTQITLTVASGEIYITFTATEMSMTSENYAVAVSVAGQTVTTQVQAAGQIEYTATETSFTSVAGTTSGVVSGNSTGQNITIDLAQMVSGGSTTTVDYTCAGDTMTWAGPYVVPMEFERVSN